MDKKKYVGKNGLATIFEVVDAKIANAKPSKVSELLNDSGFATKEDIKEAVDGINFECNGVTKENVEEMLDGYAKTDEVSNALEGYAKKEGLADYAKTSEVDTKLEEYAKLEDVVNDLAEKQDVGNYLEYTDQEGRKVVTLENADIFGAKANTEPIENQVEGVKGWVSLMQLNKWNVADFGSPKTLFNINIKKGLRPTVQEDGMSGPNAHKLAYFSDIENLESKIEEKFLKIDDFVTEDEIQDFLGDNAVISNTTSELAILKTIVQQLIATNANKAVDNSGVTSENDVIVTGKFTGDTENYATYKSTKGDVSVYGLEAFNSPVQLYATEGNITATDITLTGSMGSGYGTDAVAKKNAMTIYGGGDNILFKNVILDGECYNGFLVNNNATTVARDITFEDMAILKTNNNAILVLSMEDNGIINVKNVHMGDVKNAIRLSNHHNSKHAIAQGVVVNIENVSVTDAREKFILLEDYVTRNNPDQDLTTEQFKNIVINIKNCTFNGKKITPEMDIDEFCHLVIGKPSIGTDKEMPFAQFPDLYPTFNIL